jgi:hypothetical protein
MVEHTKLDGEAKPVARATAGSDDGPVGSVEHVVPGHGGRIGRDREQPGSLLRRRQGCERAWSGSDWRREPVHKQLAFRQQFCKGILKAKSQGNVVPAKSIRKRSFTKGSGPSVGGALLGYACVSKGDQQNNPLQMKALRAAGCRRLFEEAASCGRWDRPELHPGADVARLYNVSQPTVSRTVAQHLAKTTGQTTSRGVENGA